MKMKKNAETKILSVRKRFNCIYRIGFLTRRRVGSVNVITRHEHFFMAITYSHVNRKNLCA